MPEFEPAPERVGNEAPEGCYDSPARVDDGATAACQYGFFDARGYVVDAHFHRVVGTVVGKECGVDESGADVGYADVYVLLVCELVDW